MSTTSEINDAIKKGYGRSLWDYIVRWSEASEEAVLACTSCDEEICSIEPDDSLFALVAMAFDHRPGHDCKED